MIPPLVPVRARKRCDDDSASTENDSMRPLAPEPRRAKRRRLLDAFSSISLQKEEELASTSGMEVASPRRKSADKNRSSDTIINNMVASSSPRCATLPGKSDDNDADSSQAVAEDDDGYTTNSSLDVEDGDTEDGAEDEDDPMLSDKEASKNDVERKVYVLSIIFHELLGFLCRKLVSFDSVC